MFYHKEQTTSTNDDARLGIYRHGDVVSAERQTAGRGQRGNKWISGEGLNATFSVVLEPVTLPAREQFLISQITALSLVETLAKYDISARIKWTNDIYVGDKKIVGILIENRLCGQNISRSVVGIGINVNQTIFDKSLPNPTSIALQRGGVETSCLEVMEQVHQSIMAWYERLANQEREVIQQRYHSLLYRLDERHPFRLPSGEITKGIIRGVHPSGALIVEHGESTKREYQFKEIEFVI